MAVGCVLGCQSPARIPVEFWAAEDFQARWDNVPDPVGVSASLQPLERLALRGAINETLGIELVVAVEGLASGSPPLFPVRGLRFHLDPFQSPAGLIPVEHVTLFHALPVKIRRWPGWHHRFVDPALRRDLVYDALVPIDAPVGGQPCSVGPREPLHLWIDVHIPVDTSPGDYSSAVHWIDPLGRTRSLPMVLTVLPFKLPDSADVAVIAGLNHQALFEHHVTLEGRPFGPSAMWGETVQGPQLDQLLSDTVNLLRQHGVTPMLDRLRPQVRINSEGDLDVDWTDYDRIMEPFMDGSAFADGGTLSHAKVPFNNEFPPPPAGGDITSPSYSKTVREYLKNTAQHFHQRGWLERSFLELPVIEGFKRSSFDLAAHFGEVVHSADPRLKRMACLFPQNMALFGWWGFETRDIQDFVDGWCPPAAFYDPETMARQRESGKSTWMALDRPPYSGSLHIAAPSVYSRAGPWQAVRYQASVLYLPSVNPWPRAAAASLQECVDHDPNLLLYPGSIAGLDRPVPSKRLKQLRRGLQDLGYLSLLKTRERDFLGNEISESLSPFAAGEAYANHWADGRRGGMVESERWWTAAVKIMGDELQNSSEQDSRGSSAGLGESLAWREFLEATRVLRIEVEGVGVYAEDRAQTGPVSVECVVKIANGTRLPVEGVMRFVNLPLGWEAIEEEVDVERIDPGRVQRVALELEAEVMTWDENGLRTLELIFEESQGRSYRVSVRLPYFASQRIARPIQVDGDLSDWPQAAGNQAADFLRINVSDVVDAASPLSRPASPTDVYAVRDELYLYFGFNCSVSGTLPELPAHGNQVRYEDFMPMGDELVEILIDPLNSRTHSTEDLFHVVVKPNGIICERGIGTDPPTGRRQVWAADVSYAARRNREGWTAEVRIPLADLGDGALPRRIWGINFTRFDLAHQEFSTWSGAQSNAYDPATLGNMALP